MGHLFGVMALLLGVVEEVLTSALSRHVDCGGCWLAGVADWLVEQG